MCMVIAEGRFQYVCVLRRGRGWCRKKKKARGERDLGKFLGWEEGEMCKDGDAEAGRVS